ncbi:hypothetical protein SFB5_325G0, partial [Candidatus Arthromitus sp. SFB-5]
MHKYIKEIYSVITKKIFKLTSFELINLVLSILTLVLSLISTKY